ncbi:related to protein BIG1 [Zygosaccharomyces bailii]|nr:related to protein BIG1 [Zygosaccharomyces bailii]
MFLQWSIINLLLLAVSEGKDVVPQTYVPVILFSHNLTPELHKYFGKFDDSPWLPQDIFFDAARELVDECTSSAYVLINQPGLRKHDFAEYDLEFSSLEKYISFSSTAIALEQVEALPEDTFDQLADYTKEKCRIDKVLHVQGDNLDSFQPYIDVDKRIIHIDFPPLPEEQELRGQAISEHDAALRKIMAQIPSPSRSVIYTSLKPDTDVKDPIGRIFPHIFMDKNRELPIERNNHILNIPPPVNNYKPKYLGMSSEYISIFDEQFINENKQLLVAIATGLVGFLVFQLMPKSISKVQVQSPPKSRVDRKSTKGVDKN